MSSSAGIQHYRTGTGESGRPFFVLDPSDVRARCCQTERAHEEANMMEDRARFDAPFWAVLIITALAIGWGSITFVAFLSADRMIEISQVVDLRQ